MCVLRRCDFVGCFRTSNVSLGSYRDAPPRDKTMVVYCMCCMRCMCTTIIPKNRYGCLLERVGTSCTNKKVGKKLLSPNQYFTVNSHLAQMLGTWYLTSLFCLRDGAGCRPMPIVMLEVSQATNVSCIMQRENTPQVLLRSALVMQFFTCRWSPSEVTTSNYYSSTTSHALRSERLQKLTVESACPCRVAAVYSSNPTILAPPVSSE